MSGDRRAGARARRAVGVGALLDDPNVREGFAAIEADLTA